MSSSPKVTCSALLENLTNDHDMVVRISSTDLMDARAGLEITLFREGVTGSVVTLGVPNWSAASMLLRGVIAGVQMPPIK